MTDTIIRSTIDVLLNGQPLATGAHTIADLLASLGYDPASVATARNGEFVPRAGRAATMLTPGDRVEVVSPRQGG